MKTFFGGHTRKGFNDLCGREFVGKSCTKNLSGKFGEIRAKILRNSKNVPALKPMMERPLRPRCSPFGRTEGKCPRHAPILGRPRAYYSTRTLFARCCKLQSVAVMNTNYQRYPETEQFITAKISGNELKQGSRTRSVLRQRSSQLQKYIAARMSRRTAVEQRCAAGMADTQC